MNRTEIASLLKYCESSLSENGFVAFIDLSRRAIIKSITITGTARAHYALGALMKPVHENIKEKLTRKSYRTEQEKNYEFIAKRGHEYAYQVYGDQKDRLLDETSAMSAEIADVFAVDTYGRFISSKNILPMMETELCLITTAVTIQGEQYAMIHMNAAAVYGASKEAIDAASTIGNIAFKSASL
ncbi:hypothetical protein DL89DRAFT_256017 [Linderina pennispora]|uniref:Carboxymuconolactone decarboxylase-like domain-containing protein n=1 Tax=Linderina pennispora TaxID=61395 RepID=A0A1Y1WFT4_9FUNG|nr:uncharacterized protein DL89DRAFT_256017 [Linderina pennispora]ORX72383.1 hypothetical protein DL89DRAFT_256017 [Linderina pennispora]